MKEQYTYNYYRYQREYSQKFDTLEEAVLWAVEEELEGNLSSYSITKGDEIVWCRGKDGLKTIFCLAENLNIEC